MEITHKQALLYRAAIEKAAESLSDEVALSVPLLFPRWEVGVSYEAGFRVSEEVGGEIILYRLREGMMHTSQADWPPHLTPALWQRVDDPAEEWPEWRRPEGAHNAYAYGAKVSWNGKHWINELEANIYEPGVYGWREVE